MNRILKKAGAGALALAVGSLFLAGTAVARPAYFSTFTGIYGLSPGDDLHSCGVCHRRWDGTGARNPYGTAVEQQLYLGKAITDAILDAEAADTDLDGYSNGDEIMVHGTLPGYSCDNYTLVIDPPEYFQSIITPFVASCLEPKDILVDPTQIALVAQANTVAIATIHIVNNGTDDPITVSNYELLAGSSPLYSLDGPVPPIEIAVGDSVSIDLAFAPTSIAFATATVRITSDDPDEPEIDVSASGIGFVKTLASPEDRALCFGEAQRRFSRYSRTHMNEWARCYLDELRGRACDVGRRDQKIGAAEVKLRSFIGGAKDRRCAGNTMTPSRLDLPSTCGAPCGSIAITNLGDWASCMVCRQTAATNAMLDTSVGAVPPDLPLNVLAPPAAACSRGLVNGVRNGTLRMQKALGACRADNVAAPVPVDCDTTLAAAQAAETAKIEALPDRCRSTEAMLGCLFEDTPAPQCLGNAALAITADLVDAVFETAD